jgi:hypothetical protein
LKTFGAGKATIAEQLDYYLHIDFDILVELKFAIAETKLDGYHDCFEFELFSPSHIFVSDYGKGKLRTEFPKVWEGLDLSGK